MTRQVGVARSEVGTHGTKYTLTYDDSPQEVAGTVELTSLTADRYYQVRDRFDEPVAVGSPRWELYTAAVKKYEDWREQKARQLLDDGPPDGNNSLGFAYNG